MKPQINKKLRAGDIGNEVGFNMLGLWLAVLVHVYLQVVLVQHPPLPPHPVNQAPVSSRVAALPVQHLPPSLLQVSIDRVISCVTGIQKYASLNLVKPPGPE